MNNLSEKMLFSYTDMIYLTKEERTMFEKAPNEVWWERISQNANATKQSKTNQEEINEKCCLFRIVVADVFQRE